MEDQERLKQVCTCIPDDNGSQGTGYLLAPRRVGTAAHVVESWTPGRWYDVTLGVGEHTRTNRARLLRIDGAADAAVLELEDADRFEPLQISRARPAANAPWSAMGYPQLANAPRRPATPPRAATLQATAGPPAGTVMLPLTGTIQDSDWTNHEGRSALLLNCVQAGQGNASPMHGWSGSPVLVDGALVGHVRRHFGDVEDRSRPAYGFVVGCPLAAVLALLDVPARIAEERQEPRKAPAPGHGDIPELLSWCDRTEIYGYLDDLLASDGVPVPSLLCTVGSADNKQMLLMDRMATELERPPRLPGKLPVIRRVRACHTLHDFGFDPLPKLRRTALGPLGAKADEDLAAIMNDSELDLLMLCHYCDCTDWSAAKVGKLLRNARAWTDGLRSMPRRLVFVLTLRFHAPSLLDRLMGRSDKVARRVRAAFAKEFSDDAPLELTGYEKDDLRKWLDRKDVREGLGTTASAIDDKLIDAWFGRRNSCGHGELVRYLQDLHNAQAAQARNRS